MRTTTTARVNPSVVNRLTWDWFPWPSALAMVEEMPMLSPIARLMMAKVTGKVKLIAAR